MKFHIITLGCKVNAYESEIIKEKLLADDFKYTMEEEADIIIINTCSVTNMADNKSKKYVRHAKRLNKILVVCGCSSENNKQEYEDMDIDILIGTKDKSKINEIIKEYLKNNQKVTKFYQKKLYEFEDMQINKFTTQTRAFVKIQDGCNNFCSYCIIPYVRKNIRSKDFETAIKEIKTLVANGHKEIVLTGIHTGSYYNNGHDLADLITEIAKIPDLKRIRISSIEITELNDKMLKVIKNEEKVCNHFHVPLQAGSDKILKIMNRKYNLDFFFKKVTELRKLKSDVAITTDVIVGHPYETEEDFQETLATCEKIGFAKIHVFPYSKRDGTVSSTMPEVSNEEKKRRSHVLNELSKKLEKEYLKKYLNKELLILTEEVTNFYTMGLTANYIRVKIEEKLQPNTFYSVKAKSISDEVLICEVIDVKDQVHNLQNV